MALDDALRVRFEVEDLYADYVACLDQDKLERRPDFFVDEAVYPIVARENYDQDLSLATMLCEGKGMLRDRVNAIRETSMFAPRSLRHLVSGVRVQPDGAAVRSEANYAVFETLVEGETRVFSTGRYLDRLVREAGAWRFRERTCIYDTTLIVNSLIYPI